MSAAKRPTRLIFLVLVVFDLLVEYAECRAALFCNGGTGQEDTCPQGSFQAPYDETCTQCENLAAFSPSGSNSSLDCIGGTPRSTLCTGNLFDRTQPHSFWRPLESCSDLTWHVLPGGLEDKMRYGHSAVSVEEFVIVFGGRVVDAVGYDSWGNEDDAVHVLDAHLPRLTWMTAIVEGVKPTGRHFHSAVMHESMMIVYGGTSTSSEMQDLMTPWVLDTATFQWERKHSSQQTEDLDGPGVTARYGHSAVMIESQMIIFGGKTSDSACLSDVWVLSTDTWTWERPSTSGAGPSGMCWHSAVAVETRMVVCGGNSDEEGVGPTGGVWELDTQLWQWTSLSSASDAPSSIRSAVLFLGRLSVFSGACQAQYGCEMSYFDLNTNTWQAGSVSTIASTPGEQSSSSIAVGGKAQRMVATNSTLFVLGGASENGFSSYLLRSVQDLASTSSAIGIREVLFLADSRRSASRYPAPRERSAAAELGDRVVLFGGLSTSFTNPGDVEFEFFGDTWVLDLRTSTWEELEVNAALPAPPRRHGHSMVSNGSAILVFGGARGYVDPAMNLPCHTCSTTSVLEDLEYAVFDDVWVFSPESMWSRVHSVSRPAGREGHAAVIANGAMLVIGGADFSLASAAAGATVFDDVWSLDLASNTWSDVTPLDPGPGGLFHHAAVAFGDLVIVVGGCRIGANITLEFIPDLWSLQQQSSGSWMWQRLAGETRSVARAGHSALLVGSSVVIFGGYRLDEKDPSCSAAESRECIGSASDTWKLWVSDAEGFPGGTWAETKVDVLNPPNPRRHHVAVRTGPDYFVFGGGDDWVGTDGYNWKTQFPDAASLPISSIVSDSAGDASSTYFAAALDFMSVLLPQQAAFRGARVRAAHVLVESRRPGSPSRLEARASHAMQCDVADGCTDLVLREIEWRPAATSADGQTAVKPLLHARGGGARVQVLGGSFVAVRCATVGCAIRLDGGAEGDVSSVLFRNMSASGQGGAIVVVGGRLSASSCVFDGSSSEGAGGAISVVVSAQYALSRGGIGEEAVALVHNCSFRSNAAKGGGGALSCGEQATCNVSACAFVGNEARGSSHGGAISSRGSLGVSGSVFEGNTAVGGGGGAVYWVEVRPDFDVADDLELCVTESHSDAAAVYGPCVASSAVRVLFGAGASFEPELREQFPGQFLEPHLRAVVHDFYNQSVSAGDPREMPAHVFAKDGAQAVLQGASAVAQVNGSRRFDFWDLYVLLAYSSVGENASRAPGPTLLGVLVDDLAGGKTLQATVEVHFAEQPVCPTGHVLKLSTWDLSGVGGRADTVMGACTLCPAARYTLSPLYGHDANGTHAPGAPSCLQCPLGARCGGGEALEGIGDWVENGREYVLSACPNGYARLIGSVRPDGVEYEHNNQQCQQCRSDGTEYVLNSTFPGRGCQECPLGLLCFGNETVVPRVNNSRWDAVGEVLVLRSCPAGYELLNDTLKDQRCEPCSFGAHNIDGNGRCTPCPIGTFKNHRNPEPCSLCPSSSFQPFEGATSCNDCPQFTLTSASDISPLRSACLCDGLTYAAGGNEDFECLACPLGAICPGGFCSLSSSNLSCPDGTAITGQWERDNASGRFLLVSCPAGYSLVNTPNGTSMQGETQPNTTSLHMVLSPNGTSPAMNSSSNLTSESSDPGMFFHDGQHCSPCSPEGQYILNPNTDVCQECPSGLRCNGTDFVVPKVAGSEWIEEGAEYRLRSCPTGYFVFSGESSVEQECRPCPQGSECTLSHCIACTPCPEGTFKDSVGIQACLPCPNNTFGRTEGAAEIGSCALCPDGAFTAGDGQSDPRACVCEPRRYLVDDPQSGVSCRSCPEGAICADGECALRHENISCLDGTAVVGAWERDVQDSYVLTSCPDGYERINSEDGSVNGTFSHDAQECRPCLDSQYVIDPNRHRCQRCPAGLICRCRVSGGVQVEAQLGAEWSPVAGEYKLQSCPSGHYVHAPSQLQQQCVPCEAGAHCPTASCTACEACPTGTFKEMAGSYPCRECPRNTYQPETGSRVAAECVACPEGSTTNASAQASIDSCECDRTLYHAGAPFGQGVMECATCPEGAECFDGSCVFSNANPSQQCSTGDAVVGVWERTASDGRFVLQSCPAGYSLLNTDRASGSGTFNHDLQACIPCQPGTEYIINPNTDACQPCPLGLECDGTSFVVPTLNGSVWEICDTCVDSDSSYALKYCPTGHYPITSPPSAQRCESCGIGSECKASLCEECTLCLPGFYKSTTGASPCEPCPVNTYNPNTGSTTIAECIRCTTYGYTLGTNASREDQCLCQSGSYSVSAPGEDRVCALCPTGAICADASCAFERSPPSCPDGEEVEGTWERSNVTDQFVLLNCSDGFSLVNSADGTSSGAFSHQLQRCEPCSAQEYVIRPDVHSCQRCPPGLICDGTSGVVPRLDGAVWVRDDDVYRLVSCAAGHRLVSGSDAEQQDCEPCGVGEECVSSACVECTPCGPGTYKDSVSPDACQDCPVNTFGTVEGATVEEQCIACPNAAVTEGTGHTDPTDCFCVSTMYPITNGSDVSPLAGCKTCPDGATCSDGACSLQSEQKMCPDGPVVGTWERSEADGTYLLTACPDGYRLVNSSELTSSGTFSHDRQACTKCPTSTYSLSPMFECKGCQAGILCSGVREVTPLVLGSEVVPVGDTYWLASCPTGYRRQGFDLADLSTASNAQILQQACIPCSYGEHCTNATCLDCETCPQGTYKDDQSPSPCTPCPLGTYGTITGASSQRDCSACPTGAVTFNIGETDVSACTCEPSHYRFGETGSVFSSTVAFQCSACPQGALCPDGFCAFRNANQSCSDGSGIVGDWQPDSSGAYYLKSCPSGYSLQNQTGGLFDYVGQRCVQCLETEYIIFPNSQDCQLCPRGLECRGDDVVEEKVPDSVWELIDGVYHLTGCPTGYFLETSTLVAQRCSGCPVGYECTTNPCSECTPCAPGYYKEGVGAGFCEPCPRDTYNPKFAASSVSDCLPCPVFASTPRNASVQRTECDCAQNTYIGFAESSAEFQTIEEHLVNNTQTWCNECPVGAECSNSEVSFCALRREDQICPEGDTIVGNWSRLSFGGEFRLTSCPDGYSLVNSLDGTSTGLFWHGAQQCVKCLAGEQYILNPNEDECQRCPPGLACDGTDKVKPVINGSEWVPEGDIYRLLWCPAGYSVFNGQPVGFEPPSQECRECLPGEFCDQDDCTECTPCPAGTYKELVGDAPCQLCPNNTYGPSLGASSIAQCLQCPTNSVTEGPGRTSVQNCICDPAMYLVSTQGEPPLCEICPAGALCPGTPRICAINLPNYSCPTTGRILGEWDRDPDNYFRLLSCPPGSSMVNSSTGTSVGVFEHDVQQCVACKTCPAGQTWCSTAEYVLDPRWHICQECPYGAECDGSQLRTANSLDFLGARWSPEEDGALWIVLCPTGYRLMNHTGYANQQCMACPAGEYVFRPDHPRFVCHPCPAGATCLNGAPPVFGVETVSSLVVIDGLVDNPSQFSSREYAVMIASLEQSIPAPAGSVAITGVCDTNGMNCVSDGTQARRRSTPRHLLQATTSGVSVGFQVLSDSLTPSDLQGELTRSDFTSSLVTNMIQIDPTLSGLTITGMEPPALGNPPSSKGERYLFDSTGQANLWFCGIGYLLVNDTFSLQRCSDCYATTYTLYPTDYCEPGGLCAQRDCSRCPRGARCDGGSHFEGLGGSTWEVLYHEDVRALLYRVTSCTLGQLLIRIPELPAEDQCLECPQGSYALEATNINKTYLRPSKGDSVIGDLYCFACPRGATCPGQLAVEANDGFWRGEDMICPSSKCGSGGACNPTFCESYPGSREPGLDEDELWRVRALVFPCRPRHCLGSAQVQAARREDNNTSDEIEVAPFINYCRNGHHERLCGVCQSGWTMTGATCRYCGKTGTSNEGFGGYLAFLVVVLIVFAYFAAWRPLLQEYEDQLLGVCFPEAEESDEKSWWDRITVEIGEGAVMDYIKELLSFYQVAGNFILKTNVLWPQVTLDYFLTVAAAVNLDFFSFPGISCVFDVMSFQLKLLFVTLGVPIIVTLFAVPVLTTQRYFRHLQDACQDSFLWSSLFFLYLTYPFTSRTVFDVFACADLGVDGQWLKSDIDTLCPAVDGDKFTLAWGILCILAYPIGVPCLMLYLMRKYEVHTSVDDKMKQSYMLATLHKYKLQNRIPLLIAKRLSKHKMNLNQVLAKRIDEVKTYRLERLSSDGVDTKEVEEEPDFKLVVDDLRELMSNLHIWDSVPHSELQGMIDRYGSQGTINRKELVSMVEQVLATRSVLTGEEDPSSLSREQLQKLCESNQFEVAHYEGSASGSKRDSYQRQHRESGGGGKSAYGVHTHEELVSLLIRRAKAMEAKGELDIPDPTWDGAMKVERKAIGRVGFLFRTHRARYWWFSIADLVHKVFMAAAGAFAFEGTPSQLGVGLIVTLAFLVLTLVLKPYRNSTIGNMHEYSLFAQGVTWFYGMTLTTTDLDSLIGEEGTPGRETTTAFILFINVLIIFYPVIAHLLALCLRPALSQLKKSLASSSVTEVQKKGAPAGDLDSEPASDFPWSDFMDVVMALRQFLRLRSTQAGHRYDELDEPREEADGAYALAPDNSEASATPATTILSTQVLDGQQKATPASNGRLSRGAFSSASGSRAALPGGSDEGGSAGVFGGTGAVSPVSVASAAAHSSRERQGLPWARSVSDTPNNDFNQDVPSGRYSLRLPDVLEELPTPAPDGDYSVAVSVFGPRTTFGERPALGSGWDWVDPFRSRTAPAAGSAWMDPGHRPLPWQKPAPRKVPPSPFALEAEAEAGARTPRQPTPPRVEEPVSRAATSAALALEWGKSPSPGPPPSPSWLPHPEQTPSKPPPSVVQKDTLRFQGEAFPEDFWRRRQRAMAVAAAPADDGRPSYLRRPVGLPEAPVERAFISPQEVARRRAGMGIVRMHSGLALALAVQKAEDKERRRRARAGLPQPPGAEREVTVSVKQRWKRSLRKKKWKGPGKPPPWPALDYEGSSEDSGEEGEGEKKIFDLATGSRRVLAVQSHLEGDTRGSHQRGPADLEISLFNPISRINLAVFEIHNRDALRRGSATPEVRADLVHAFASSASPPRQREQSADPESVEDRLFGSQGGPQPLADWC